MCKEKCQGSVSARLTLLELSAGVRSAERPGRTGISEITAAVHELTKGHEISPGIRTSIRRGQSAAPGADSPQGGSSGAAQRSGARVLHQLIPAFVNYLTLRGRQRSLALPHLSLLDPSAAGRVSWATLAASLVIIFLVILFVVVVKWITRLRALTGELMSTVNSLAQKWTHTKPRNVGWPSRRWPSRTAPSWSGAGESALRRWAQTPSPWSTSRRMQTSTDTRSTT